MLSNLIFIRRFDYRNESNWCNCEMPISCSLLGRDSNLSLRGQGGVTLDARGEVQGTTWLNCTVKLLTITAWPGRGVFPEKLGGRLRPLPKALALYIQLFLESPDRIWRGRQRSNCAVINPTSADCSNKQLTQEGNFESSKIKADRITRKPNF